MAQRPGHRPRRARPGRAIWMAHHRPLPPRCVRQLGHGQRPGHRGAAGGRADVPGSVVRAGSLVLIMALIDAGVRPPPKARARWRWPAAGSPITCCSAGPADVDDGPGYPDWPHPGRRRAPARGTPGRHPGPRRWTWPPTACGTCALLRAATARYAEAVPSVCCPRRPHPAAGRQRGAAGLALPGMRACGRKRWARPGRRWDPAGRGQPNSAARR